MKAGEIMTDGKVAKGDERRGLLQAHLDKYVYDGLNKRDLRTVASHELVHLDIYNADKLSKELRKAGKTEAAIETAISDKFGAKTLSIWNAWNKYKDRIAKRQKREITGEDQENFVNKQSGSNIARVSKKIERLISERLQQIEAAISTKLLASSDRMARAVKEGKGPDVVIVVNSTDAQRDFWGGKTYRRR